MRLNLKREPEWFDLIPGVRVKCAPATSAVMAHARRDPVMDEIDENASEERTAVAFGKAVAFAVIEAWEGVEGPDGKPCEPSREYIDAFLDDFRIFDAWQTQYMARWLGLEDEKNGSAPSPSGSSAGAGRTAKPARKSAKSARSRKTAR